MFAIPGIVALIVFIYIRPQEFILPLRVLPLLYLFFAAAIFGFGVDLKLRRIRPMLTPQLGWAGLFFAWCMLTLAVRAPGKIPRGALELGISIILYLLIGHGVQTFRAFQLVVGTLLAVTLFLSAVGVHQGTAPFGCHVIDTSDPGDLSVGVYDGRPCENERECLRDDPEPGADYLCERVGLFGTSSIGKGRVRYLGPLQDPNELSLAIGIGLPFAFAFFERKRSSARLALLVTALALVGTCTVFTQSRGGQLVFLAAVGAYFVKRYGWKGMIFGAVLALPLLMLGGRSGEEAESSSLERLECWYEGMSMFKQYPIFGVGQGQFTEHHFLTAHNSYVLAPAELGFPGMVLWSIVMYITVKIPVSALRRLRALGPEADVARTWGMGLLAALLGLLVGIFFLSFCYHQSLWIYIGLSGGFYCALKRHDPDWDVKFAWRDFFLVVAIDVMLVALLFVYTRLKAP
ncbi:MAG TPA: O-antigen ligase family protein [Polyangia bacterium]|nr:O-antigen ligase family protein [Polyangia bacterium]